MSEGALAGLRVLDLSDRFAHYCGKLFADLGAEVILVEKPGEGTGLRRMPPFLDDIPGPDRGLPFLYLAANRLSVALDLDTAEGQARFRDLARGADLVIEDAAPGTMARRGLDHAALAAIRPAIVTLSITPFGQTGPYARYAADDLTLIALGGFLSMMGYPDEPPSAAWGEQAFAMGSMFGAVGAMLAVLHAEATGTGQQVDVAIQECAAMAMENAAQFWDLEGRVRRRFAGEQRHAGTGLFGCADGHIYLFAGGMAAARFWPNLVAWLAEERVPGAEELQGPDWSTTAFLDTPPAKRRFAEIFTPFAASRSKAWLYREGQARRVPLCPVATSRDILESGQLRARDFLVEATHPPSGRRFAVPGAPYRLSATPWRLGRPAPSIGEHTAVLLAGASA